MRPVQINSSNADVEQLRQLYDTAFPAEERIPYDDIIHLLDVMNIDYTTYYDEETLVGLTMILRLPRFNWGWYFAVREDLRGKGYGQAILTAILNKYREESRPFILDIESPLQTDAPNPVQRKRRHAFYLHNGLRDTGTCRTYNGITFTILSSSDAPFTSKDYDDIVAALRAAWERMPGQE